jgi:hypothetical protein
MYPVGQSASFVHSGFGSHLPLKHWNPVGQSASTAHCAFGLHVPPEQ